MTVEPANSEIKRSDPNAKFTFLAGDEAPLGDFQIMVTGHPTNGSDADIDFKLKITPKDSFTLNLPSTSPLKQGESQTVVFGIKREKSFDLDVAISFGDLPTGVTL